MSITSFFKKSILVIFSGLLMISLLGNFAYAKEGTDSVELLFFYGEGCPHCARAERFLAEMEEKYPKLEVQSYETYFDDQNRDLFLKSAEAYEVEAVGVPMIFVGDEVYTGFNNNLGNEIEEKIDFCSAFECESPLQNVGIDQNQEQKWIGEITVIPVLAGALVDAINPCAFAVLIILLTTILVSRNRRKALFAGLAFAGAIFISYFLMGLGLYTAIQSTGLSHTFMWFVAILAILIGLFNLKDYFWYGKWFIMEVPRSWRPKMKALIKGVTSIPGAFAIGFLVSLFLLPCTSGPYIVILGLLASSTQKAYATILLLIYNLVFILPMIIITLAVYFGFTSTKKAEEWRQGKLQVLHLIAGLIILTLGLGMILAIILGYV